MTNLAPPDLAEPQPALAPLWPDVARALAAVAAGCTVGILIRIGLWDTGYFPNSYFRLSHVPLALPPIMCVILGALAMRSLFPPEHPPPASVAFGAATLLIAGGVSGDWNLRPAKRVPQRDPAMARRGNPNASLHTLTNPGSFTGGTMTFSAPASATLAKETDYFVVLENTATSVHERYDLDSTASNAEDSGAASGWAIGYISHSRSSNSGSWSNHTNALMIAHQGHGNRSPDGDRDRHHLDPTPVRGA